MKHKLNVFTEGYLPAHPRYWWHNFCQFFYNIKYAYQRAVYGYCDRDLWDCRYFYFQLFGSSLKQFAKLTHTWPVNHYKTYEDWKAAINDCADKFDDLSEEVEFNFNVNTLADYTEFYKHYKQLQNETMDWLRDNIDEIWD